MDRNPISNLEAVAAMPGLEVLADVIDAHRPPGQGSAVDPLSALILLAGRWAFGSANVCDSVFLSTDVWASVRASASRVGRVLPEAPPTFDKLRHLRDVLDDGVYRALADALTDVAVPLAKELGLLGGGTGSWHRPHPGRVIYGDGSVFAPLSGVTVDGDGVVQGSRAKQSPRLAPTFEGKDGPRAATGLPITVVGCHGRPRWLRVLLGVDLFDDANEIGSSLTLLEKVIGLAGGGVSHVVYDRLMSGVHMRRLMRLGVLPVVAMSEAAAHLPHLVLPAELQHSGYRSAGAREKRKGKGARRRSADDVAPKARVAIHQLGSVTHELAGRACVHEIWTIDGSVVTVAAGEEVTLDAAVVESIGLRWENHLDGTHPVGRYRLPCGGSPHHFEIDFAEDRRGKNKHGEPLALADWVRPLPESSSGFARISGYRSDVESVFSWLKAMLPHERAASLEPQHFFLDVVGAALLCNAIAWDVHGAQHTACAQHEARLGARRHLRAA